jgi:hypothetical protein
MERMRSGIGIGAIVSVDDLKNKQESSQQPNRLLASSGIVHTANPDVDKLKMLNPVMGNMTMVAAGATGSVYNTLAIRDPHQDPGLLPALYSNYQEAVTRKSGSGSIALNVLVPGETPVGYDSSDYITIQRRTKYYYNGDATDPDNSYYTWRVQAVKVPRNYQLQPNERYDNGFLPAKDYLEEGDIGSIWRDMNYGNSFVRGENGGILYSPSRQDPVAAWSGVAKEADGGPGPTLGSLSYEGGPAGDSITVPAGAGGQVTITGPAFANVTMRIGPYAVFFEGFDPDTVTGSFHLPGIPYFSNGNPNKYNLTVIDQGGAVSVKPQAIIVSQP